MIEIYKGDIDIDYTFNKRLESMKFEINIVINCNDMENYIFQIPEDKTLTERYDSEVTNDLYSLRDVISNTINYIKEQILLQSDGRFTLRTLPPAVQF